MAALKKKKTKKEKGGIVVRGKRKEAVARAAIRKGRGAVRVNRMDLGALSNRYVRTMIAEPLRLAPEVASAVDIDVSVYGGGSMGQAQAARTAIARAIVEYSHDDSLRQKMIVRDKFLLAEDSRRVEPKKYKGPKARARFQKSYR